MSFPFLLAILTPQAIVAVIAIPVSLMVGFAFGLIYERWYHASQLQRTSKRFEKLFAHVSGCLDKTEQACRLLREKAAHRPLSPEQQATLESTLGRVNSQVAEIPARKREAVVQPASSDAGGNQGRKFKIPGFVQQPADERTGFPDALAFEQNLQRLEKAHSNTSATSGILYVKMDQYSRLESRLGAEAADALVKQLATSVLRELGQDDLVCQISEDSLVALLPGRSGETVEQLCQRIRSSLQEAIFLNPQSGSQILVTATLGWTLWSGAESSAASIQDVVENRRQLALKTTARHGRWQLREVRPDGTTRLVAG